MVFNARGYFFLKRSEIYVSLPTGNVCALLEIFFFKSVRNSRQISEIAAYTFCAGAPEPRKNGKGEIRAINEE